jgi:hypothetical protein
MSIETAEISLKDLRRISIPTKERIDNRPAVVYRLNKFDSSAPLYGRQVSGGDIEYYSMMVLLSSPPSVSINRRDV